MECREESSEIKEMRKAYPEKFLPEDQVFGRIHAGDRIFIGTGCGEPQHLVQALISYIESNPKAFYDAEVLHVWTLGVAPYATEKFQANFRHNSFFIGSNTRDAVNKGIADYTPIFLSEVPDLFRRRLIPVDVALIQTSPPDRHGYMSLGVSVDIVKAASQMAPVVIAQINANMPRTHGDSFIHIKEVDFLLSCDEPLLEYETALPSEIANRVGTYVSRIVEDGDTIQVGYGSVPIAVLSNLEGKHDLGVHTELLSDGVVDLIKKGVITNSRKNIDTGKTIAAFCMGKKDTYEYIDDNPTIELRTIDYTNSPAVISRIRNMTAINSALEIDLTGQATSESLGKTFYSGVGGQADFMRGAVLAPGGKTILIVLSTAQGGKVSRIVPFLREGAGVTLTRGDVHYVVTEHGIAYLQGRNVRERAMALIAIAHPDFQPWLMEEARKQHLVYKDQAFVPGRSGAYPEHLETYRTTKTGLEIFLRPVRITDEGLLKDFFYSLSLDSLYKRFMSWRFDMTHERLQQYIVPVDYTKEMGILALVKEHGIDVVIGVGQYIINEDRHTAEVAIVVRDRYQNRGVGYEILSYLTYIAQRRGLLGFTAEVLIQNEPMLHLFGKMGFDIERTMTAGVYELELRFKK
ncbi:MAG: Succinyl-CoA:coenzyme A transferase [Syntrophorhabdaceae bacterium PtaU1.Bin034]|nr:MAG: Succinyl-CoA:coenzyme A transferase [Syntrophorhabdaceae bacterium PtaU1.Bin034]